MDAKLVGLSGMMRHLLYTYVMDELAVWFWKNRACDASIWFWMKGSGR